MAGRARAKALIEALDKRAADVHALSTDQLHPYEQDSEPTQPYTSLNYVADWIESGNTIKELAAELSRQLAHEVTYARIMATLREQHGATATEDALDASRARASHSLAETAMELVDAPADSNVDVSRAASRARTRQWMAERYNPAKYGMQKGVSVSVSIGLLHLDALRAQPARATAIVTGSSEQRAITDGGSSEDDVTDCAATS